MPLTTKGKKIKKAMQSTYGKKKGANVFYASANKGKVTNVKKKASPTTAKKKQAGATGYSKGGETKSKSRVNEAGNYTKPTMRKRLFNKIKAGSKGGKPGQWSARKAQMLAREYKAAGGGYKS